MCLDFFYKKCQNCNNKNKYTYKCNLCHYYICIKCWDPLSNMCLLCYEFWMKRT